MSPWASWLDLTDQSTLAAACSAGAAGILSAAGSGIALRRLVAAAARVLASLLASTARMLLASTTRMLLATAAAARALFVHVVRASALLRLLTAPALLGHVPFPIVFRAAA